MRSPAKFDLVEVADDAALLVQSLGLAEVVTVGYSMGGPISLLLTQRHPQLVRALVVQATALEWRAKWYERLEWKTVHVMGPVLRSSMFPRWMRWGIRRLLGPNHPLEQYVPWLACELSRNDTFSLVHAGQSLSRYDARVFASALGKPAASMVTTRDRLVKPRKQRALADALNAFVTYSGMGSLVVMVLYAARASSIVLMGVPSMDLMMSPQLRAGSAIWLGPPLRTPMQRTPSVLLRFLLRAILGVISLTDMPNMRRLVSLPRSFRSFSVVLLVKLLSLVVSLVVSLVMWV